MASDSNPFPASHRLRTTPVAGPWIRRNRNPGSRRASSPDRLRQRRAERVLHDGDLARQAELELGAGEPGGHRVAGEVASRQHEISGADGILLGGRPPPVTAPARASDEEHPHSRPPENPERLPLAPAKEWVLVDDLAVGRDAQELPPARRPVVLHLRAQPVRRSRTVDAEPDVSLRRGHLVEAVAEAPRGAAAQGCDLGARALVGDTRVESAETAVLPGARVTGRVGKSGRAHADQGGRRPRRSQPRRDVAGRQQ